MCTVVSIVEQVVTEKTPWDGGMVGINSFGFGGANCHVLLKWNEKQKVNGGAPLDDIPRIVPASGRTEEAVDTILTDVSLDTVDQRGNLEQRDTMEHRDTVKRRVSAE